MLNWIKNLIRRYSITANIDGVPNPDPALLKLLGSIPSSSGQVVNPKTILGIPFVLSAVNLIARKVGTTPVNVYKIVGSSREIDKTHPGQFLLKRRPSQLYTPVTFKSTVTAHALIYGNGYAYIFRNEDGDPEELLILDPRCTGFIIENDELLYVTTINGERRKLLPENVIHIKGLSIDDNGMSGDPICAVAKNALGLALSVQEYSNSFFRQGVGGTLFVKMPPMDDTSKDEFRESFEHAHVGIEKSGKPLILFGNDVDAKFLSPSLQDVQLKEFTLMGALAIAQLFQIPPSYLGVTSGYTSYNSLEQESKRLLDCLSHWYHQWEEQLNKLLSNTEFELETHYVEFNRAALLEMDEKVKAEIQVLRANNNLESFEEIRRQNNMPTDKKGTFFRAANIQLVDENFEPVVPKPPEPPKPALLAPGEDSPQGNEPKGDDPKGDDPNPKEDAPEASRAILEALKRRSVVRLVTRLRKAAESGESDFESHRAVMLESLDAFPKAEAVTDAVLTELTAECKAILPDQRSKLDWTRYTNTILKGLE